MNILRTIISAIAVTSSFVTFAAPQITFVGEVNAQTCTPTINGATDGYVLLPAVSAADLSSAGKVAGLTDFKIGLTGCTSIPVSGSVTEDKINTVFLGHSVTSSGYLGNLATKSPAKEVALQIVKKDGKAVVLSGATPVDGLVLKRGSTSAEYDFGIQYISLGKATPGAVKGVVEYSLSYL